MPDDVTIPLGDPDAHAHAWKAISGPDDDGGFALVCECGETGYGHGDFEAAS